MAEIKAASHHHVAGEAASIGDGFRFPLSRNMRYCRWDTAEQQIAWLSISLSPGFRKNRQCRPTVRRDHPGIEFIARDRGASYGDTQPVSACSEAENHRQLPRFVNEMGVLDDIVTSERDPEKEPQGRYRLIEGRHANARNADGKQEVPVEAGVNRIETCTLVGADDLVMQRNKAALAAQTNTSPNRERCLPLSAIKFRGPVATDVVRQSSFPLNLVCRARSRFSRMRRMRAF
jgi:hypothetical protein